MQKVTVKGKVGKSNILLEEKGKDLKVRKAVGETLTSVSEGGSR